MSPAVDDASSVGAFPYAKVDHDNKHMYRGWLDKRLLLMRCDDCPLEDVKIGLPVELDWIDLFGAPIPVFRRREAGCGRPNRPDRMRRVLLQFPGRRAEAALVGARRVFPRSHRAPGPASRR